MKVHTGSKVDMESCFIYTCLVFFLGGNLHLFETSRHRKIRDGFGKTSKIHLNLLWYMDSYGFVFPN